MLVLEREYNELLNKLEYSKEMAQIHSDSVKEREFNILIEAVTQLKQRQLKESPKKTEFQCISECCCRKTPEKKAEKEDNKMEIIYLLEYIEILKAFSKHTAAYTSNDCSCNRDNYI